MYRISSSSLLRCSTLLFKPVQHVQQSAIKFKLASFSSYCRRNQTKLHPHRNTILFISLSVLTLMSGSFVYNNIKKKKKSEKLDVITTGRPSVGGPWSLVDHDGNPKTSADYLGKFVILYFGFTHCPDICPSELVKVGNIMDHLENQGLSDMVTPLFITLDPVRDTVAQLKHYGQDFHRSVIYLTGTNDQISNATQLYRVYSNKANEIVIMNENEESGEEEVDDEYLVDHSIAIYILHPDGKFLEYYSRKISLEDMIMKIEAFIREYKQEKPEDTRGDESSSSSSSSGKIRSNNSHDNKSNSLISESK